MILHKFGKCDKVNEKGGNSMLKQLSISNAKGIFKTYKANILKKMELKKKQDEMYKSYIMNAIREAEEDIENGGTTYTLKEFEEEMEKLYGEI